MISRYALFNTADVSNYFHIAGGMPKGVKPSYNLSPASNAPVIVNEGGTHTIKLMKWGLMAQGAKDTNSIFRYKTYNIPSEKIMSRHSWERAVRERRCLVPADGFYELNGSGKKRAFYIQPNDKALLSFAGVYSSWEDPDGTAHGTFSIVTIEATDDMPGVSGRMPVIIKREDEARWLDPSVSDLSSLYDMLRPYPQGLLTAYEVGAAVHSPKPNTPNLIDRL